MKEREKERAKKPDKAAAEGRPSGGGGGRLGIVKRKQIMGAMQRQILCVWSRGSLFPLGLENEEGWWEILEVRQLQILRFYLALFFCLWFFKIWFMGFLFLRLKTKIFFWTFFFSPSEFKLGLKKRVRFMVRVCKFVLQGVQNDFFFKNIIYIYIYINSRSRGSFEPPNYNVPPPLLDYDSICPF